MTTVLLGDRHDRWVRATIVTLFAVFQILPLVLVFGHWASLGLLGTAFLLVASLTLVFVKSLQYLAPATVVLGRDGVTVRRGEGTRFLAWAALRRVRVVRGDLLLELTTGESIRCWASLAEPVAEVARTMREALAVRALPRAVSPAVAALDWHEETASAWVHRVKSRSVGVDVYRSSGPTREALEETVRDGASPASRRLAAAMLLAGDREGEGRTRVRIVAEETADEVLRAGLEALLDGAEEEVAAKRVLRARR